MAKSFLFLAVLAAAFFLPLTSRAQVDKPEQSKVRLAVGGKVGLFYLPVTIAERLGYFKDEGLDVEMIDLTSGAKALQALVGGSADVTSGSYEHTIQMQAKGMALTAFVLQGRLIDYSLGVVTKKVPSYQTPKDLKGLKVAVSSPGAGTHMFLNAVLAKAGLKPEDVSVIGVGQTAGAVEQDRAVLGGVDGNHLPAPMRVRMAMDDLQVGGLPPEGGSVVDDLDLDRPVAVIQFNHASGAFCAVYR